MLNIKQWMTEHFMKLNEDKTEFVLIGKNSCLSQYKDISLDFGEDTIKPCDFTKETGKTLGVKLDSLLSMQRQVKDVRKKMYWTLSNLRTFGRFLSEKIRLQLVKTLILSKIDYCNSIYCGVNKTVLDGLRKSIDSAVRFIYIIEDFGVDLTPFYKKSHILPIDLRINFKVCLLTHKILMGAAPLYMQDMIKLYHTQLNKQGLRAFSDKRLLLLLSGHPETKITRRMFSHHAPP